MARPRSSFPPQTAAQRQKKCRAIKRGEEWYAMAVNVKQLPGTTQPNLLLQHATPAAPALPAPVTTAILKPPSAPAAALALPDAHDAGEAQSSNLPRAGADRLRALLARQFAGKSLTAAERAEAQGLLDLAELFVIQRLRNRLAA